MPEPRVNAPRWIDAPAWVVVGLVLAALVLPFTLADGGAYPHPTRWLSIVLAVAWAAMVAWMLALRQTGERLGNPPAPSPRLLALVLSPFLVLGAASLLRLGVAVPTGRVLFPVAAAAVGALVLLGAWRRGRVSGPMAVAHLACTAGLWGASLLLEPGTPLTPGATVALGAVWGLYIVAAFVGWGRLVARALGLKGAPDTGLAAAWGMAGVLALGAILNLGGLVSPAAVKLLLAIGTAHALVTAATRHDLWGWVRPAGRWRLQAPVLAGGLVLAAVAALQLVGSVHGTINDVQRFRPFDIHDDLQAYLVFPEKLLDQGSLGPEPFEPRRMLNLGGQSFLQALVVAALPVRQIHLLDGGVAAAMLLGLVWGWMRRERVPLPLGTLLALVAATVPHLEARGNTSSVMTGVVVLLAWFLTITHRRVKEAPLTTRAMLQALLIAAAASLKSTFIPFVAVAFVALVVLARPEQVWRERLREGALTAGLTVLVLAPWMISVLWSSGTLLYPLLGRGFHATHYFPGFGNVSEGGALGWHEVLRMLIRQLGHVWVVLLLLVVLPRRRHREAQAFAVATVVSAVAIIFLVDATLNRSLGRYIFPLAQAGLLALLGTCLAARGSGRRWPLERLAGLAVALALLAAGNEATQRLLTRLIDNLAEARAEDRVATSRDVLVHTRLLAGVPAGSPVLARLRLPFLLDFTTHRVFVMGFPGMASPPPGLPLFQGPEPVASYLRATGVRYLACSIGPATGEGSLLNLSEAEINQRYPKSRTRWAMLRYHQDFERTVRALMTSYRRVFDAGTEVVLDLGQRADTVVPLPEGARAEGLSGTGWAAPQVRVSGLRLRAPAGGGHLVVRTRGWDPRGTSAELVQPRLLAGGQSLSLAATRNRAFVFAVPAGLPIPDLQLTVAPLRPEELGARRDQAPLGIDLDSIELIAGTTAPGEPTGRLQQVLSFRILPEQVADRSGFYRDNNWSDGHGVLASLAVPVRDDQRVLVVGCRGGHPFLNDPDRLRLRVRLNGIDLEPIGQVGRELAFAVFRGLREIEEVRIESATFVPSQSGGSRDTRTLGFPVDFVELRTAAPVSGGGPSR